MKVAFVSDIHGNLPALESVREDVESKNPDKVVCLGDVIGYNPWPSECVDIVQDWCDVVLQGNHDREVQNPSKYRGNVMAHQGLLHAQNELTDAQVSWLSGLPERRDVSWGGNEYVLVHSHPTKTDKYVRPREFPNLRRHLDEFDGCLLGHTHVQHTAVIDNRLLVNPGSVGQPRDKDSRAAYAILDTDVNEIETYRVDYNIDSVISKVNELGLPRDTGVRLLDGK